MRRLLARSTRSWNAGRAASMGQGGDVGTVLHRERARGGSMQAAHALSDNTCVQPATCGISNCASAVPLLRPCTSAAHLHSDEPCLVPALPPLLPTCLPRLLLLLLFEPALSLPLSKPAWGGSMCLQDHHHHTSCAACTVLGVMHSTGPSPPTRIGCQCMLFTAQIDYLGHSTAHAASNDSPILIIPNGNSHTKVSPHTHRPP